MNENVISHSPDSITGGQRAGVAGEPADPATRLSRVDAEIAAIERAMKRLPALKRERIALRKALAKPDPSRLPYSAIGRVARRSALNDALSDHGMNWHADLSAEDAPAAALGYAAADIREREGTLAAAVRRKAEACGGNLREAARLVEREVLREWWLASLEGERAAGEGEATARMRANAHLARQATFGRGRLRPLAAALYKAATARPNALAELREIEALQGVP
ncbi:hypothetical protein [Neoroseomonas oryzicola]|uniref:Uncharacterized protein n=1 Tax=Neoroseomonas oryzicola TaxID=535904 RepID=A0A9X9WLI0_9PROT|nr:hypothetical protein [Neoroseomonas oryzicola]MBR0661190.1 hypothetical protein [Neoroseomonas oryzicola]NKE17555.1 hypothetical protein [Neoroseomonas oryzicola]